MIYNSKTIPTAITAILMLLLSMLILEEGKIYTTLAIVEAMLAKSICWGALAVLVAWNKWLRRSFLLLLGIIVEMKLFVMCRFECGFTPTVLSLLLQTNGNEASEFIQHYITWDAILIFIAFAAISYAIYRGTSWICTKCKRPKSKIVKWSLCTLCFSAIVCSIYLNTLNMETLQEQDSPIIPYEGHLGRALYTYNLPMIEARISYSCLKKDFGTVNNIIAANETTVIDSCNFTSPNIVLVIGESFIKSHSSLYGYKHNTTPHLAKEKEADNLLVFNNVITSHPRTTESIRYIFSTCGIENESQWDKYPLLPALFKKAGYNVTFHDNQSTRTASPTLFDYSYAFFFNEKRCEAQCFDYRNTELKQYDLDMVKNELKALKKIQGKHNLNIFHLYGQHLAARYRYPNTTEYTVFTKETYNYGKQWNEEMCEAIAHYDNATRYNDLVLNTIIEHYRDQDAVLLYLSDHGECVFDDKGLSCGRDLNTTDTPERTHLFFDIPFFIWTSEKYKEKHPDMVEQIAKAQNSPMMIDGVCHLLLNLAGIKTPAYRKDLCVISPDYNNNRKRLLFNNEDYDILSRDSQ